MGFYIELEEEQLKDFKKLVIDFNTNMQDRIKELVSLDVKKHNKA